MLLSGCKIRQSVPALPSTGPFLINFAGLKKGKRRHSKGTIKYAYIQENQQNNHKNFSIFFKFRFPGSRGSHPIFRSAQLLRKKSKSNLYNNIIILLYRYNIILFNGFVGGAEICVGTTGTGELALRMGLLRSLTCSLAMEFVRLRGGNNCYHEKKKKCLQESLRKCPCNPMCQRCIPR